MWRGLGRAVVRGFFTTDDVPEVGDLMGGSQFSHSSSMPLHLRTAKEWCGVWG